MEWNTNLDHKSINQGKVNGEMKIWEKKWEKIWNGTQILIMNQSIKGRSTGKKRGAAQLEGVILGDQGRPWNVRVRGRSKVQREKRKN